MYRDIFRIVLIVGCVASAGILAADTVLTPPQIAAGTSVTLSDFTVDAAGAQYIVGSINGGATVDLNPGVGDVSRTAAGTNAAFIIKLNADSSFAWGHSFDGSSSDFGDAVTLSGGFAYMAGRTNSTDAGFDGAVGTSAVGAFIAAFDTGTGAAKGDFDGDGHAEYADFSTGVGAKITVSGGNLFLGGTSTGNLAQVAKISASSGALDLGFSTDGLQNFGGGTSFPTLNGVAADGTRVYICGSFSGTSAGVGAAGAVNSVGFDDGFVVGLNLTDGSADSTFSGNGVLTFGGTNSDAIQCISISNGTIYVGGPLGSTDAGFDGAGTISKSATAGSGNDGFIIALDSAGTPVNGFDTDGVLLFPPPGNGGSVVLVRASAEFGGGVTTPGIAVQLTQSPSNGIPNQVVVGDFDGNGARRVAFGINGEIKFDSNSSENGVNVLRANGRTTIAAIGASSASMPFIYANNLIPRVLEIRTRIVASFSSDTGSPLFPHFLDVFPRADDVAGGRTVTFIGGGFPAGAPSVKIGVADATAVSTTNGTKFTATIPAGTAGDKPVAITLPGGRVLTIPDAFAYGNKAQATGPVFRGPALGGTVDADGNTYLVGNFSGTVDFDPSAGSDMHRSGKSVVTGFVTRFNANGSYAWTSLLTGIGNTTLNGVAVKGNRVYAVGAFQFVNLSGEATSNVGINGLSGQLCQGAGDGVIIALDRASGLAVTSVSGDGIVTVGGSTDTFPNYDALHSLVASPTSTTFAAGGRIASSNAGFEGLGAIPTGGLFFNFDSDGNVTQNTSLAYAQTPPFSATRSALVAYSPDGTKVTGAVLSGNQVDVKQFNGNYGVVLNSFGTAGVKSNTFGSNLSLVSIDESNSNIVIAATKSNGTATVQTLNNSSGVSATPVEVTPKAGQTPARNVGSLFAAYSLEDLTLAVAADGDATLTDGTTSVDLSAQAVGQFDSNILIVKGTLANLLGLGSSLQVIKGDGGGREDGSVLISTPSGVKIAGESTSPSTVVRKGTETATPGAFKGFIFDAANGGGGPDNVPPNITSPTLVELVAGEEFVYNLTATGTQPITFSVTTPINPEPESKINILESKGLNPITITRVGDQLRVKCLLAGTGFTIGVTASNAIDNDSEAVVFTTGSNPKAPDIKLAPPYTSAATVPLGDLSVPFTLTGDQPIDLTTTFGTLGGSTLAVELLAKGTAIITLMAVNAFGADIEFVVLSAVPDEEADFDNDKIPNGVDPDDDNDGYPDTTELKNGTLPRNPGSMPSTGTLTKTNTGTNKSTSVQVTPDDEVKDSILDSFDMKVGTVIGQSRAAPKPTPGSLLYEFGGVQRLFVINEKGIGVSGNDKCTLKLKSVKGEIVTSVSVSIKKANIKLDLADEGLTDRNAKKEVVSVTSFIAYDGTAINRTVPLEYSAKQGKKGSAKLKK